MAILHIHIVKRDMMLHSAKMKAVKNLKKRKTYHMNINCGTNYTDSKYCITCAWYEVFEGVCCCADSEWTADFRNRDYVCDCWEKKTDDK